jgi:hypothetical protein
MADILEVVRKVADLRREHDRLIALREKKYKEFVDANKELIADCEIVESEVITAETTLRELAVEVWKSGAGEKTVCPGVSIAQRLIIANAWLLSGATESR